MPIFKQGSNWEASRVFDLEKSRKTAWIVAGALGVCFVASAISLAVIATQTKIMPYVVMKDRDTGNIEVLQTFDNRTIGNQVLMNKYWARAYVQAREQYSWYLVGADYESVQRLTDPTIFAEYGSQFAGEQSLDKVFGDFTERRINILSITPSPSNPALMTVRFERTTVSKGMIAESPTIFVATIAFRYVPKAYGAEADLIRNPVGYQVYSYRRDVEQKTSTPVLASETATEAAK